MSVENDGSGSKLEKGHSSHDAGNSSIDEGGEVGAVAGLQSGLKSRHAQMIALGTENLYLEFHHNLLLTIPAGGTIGTGLFVGSGQVLHKGGPGFLLLAYLIMTAFVLFVATAVIELATYMPVKGGTMSYFGTRYVSKSLGFAMGWLYWYSLCILVPYEITAAAVVFCQSFGLPRYLG